MPNHTQNTLHVSGKKSDIDKFLAHMGEDMDFEKVIPSPENMFRDNLSQKDKERLKSEGVPNWYDWQSENWGTKWNAYECEFRKENLIDDWYGLTYEFLTAWSTPEPVIRKLVLDWPDLEISGGWVDEGYEGCGSFCEFWPDE